MSAPPPPAASVQLVCGCTNGFSPSIILRVSGVHSGLRSRAEYVFGVGESFSRAVLEHKVRPNSDLRATFCSSLSSQHIGGLGGLVLRLRSDGHKQVGTAYALLANMLCATDVFLRLTNDRWNALLEVTCLLQTQRVARNFAIGPANCRWHAWDQLALPLICAPCATSSSGSTPRWLLLNSVTWTLAKFHTTMISFKSMP